MRPLPRLTTPVTGLALLGAVALLGAGCGDRTPTAAPAPPTEASAAVADVVPATASGPTEVPDGFPLAAGLPRRNGDGSPVTVTDRPTWTSVELCGRTAWSAGTPVAQRDTAGATYTGEAEDVRSRVLAVHGTDAEATSVLGALRRAYSDCPQAEEGGTDQVYEVVEDEPDAITVTHRYRSEGRFDTGLEVIEVRAVGTAVLLTSTYGEGGGSPESIAAQVAFAHDASRPVVEAMSVFAGGASPTDPASLPLASGWPERAEPGQDGVVSPAPRSEPIMSAYVCGPGPRPRGAERVDATFTDVEDRRSRSMRVFPDADAAAAHVAAVRSFWEGCPPQSDQGFDRPLVVADSPVGGQSFSVVAFTEVDGSPVPGLVALHVVRVGRSVLLDSTSDQGGAGAEPRGVQARRQVERMTTDSADLVAAMCAWTEAGC
ncbi:hypothetical protein [Nocardioides litoris]|uniref:hypothetical protein n=1 Tax=Nocardioides litoris TaxID=1926648 RepID=UPI00111D8A93|nr:hypothetical protein [Nocardioides litoris]